MSQKLWSVGTNNAFSTTLSGALDATSTTINLTTTANLQAPGILVIDRVDANNNATPTIREYISYTGINANSLTGCTRGKAGSTAQSHSSGATAEETWSIDHWNDAVSFLNVSHDASGNIVAISMATLTDMRITNSINASGASITGLPITPTFFISGTISGATSPIGAALSMPQNGKLNWVSFIARAPASSASVVFDVLKNGVSIFNTWPTIAGAGTFISSASINTPSYVTGDIFQVGIKTMSPGLISDIVAELRGN